MSYYSGAFRGNSLAEHLAFLTLAQSCIQSALIDLQDLISLCHSEACQSLLEYGFSTSFGNVMELTVEDLEPNAASWERKKALLIGLLRSSQKTISRLCLDIDLTPHCERRFDPNEHREIAKLQTESLKRITACILSSPKLQHLTITSKFFRSFEHLDIRFFLRIMSSDSLKTIQFDGFPCDFENSDTIEEPFGVDTQHVNKVGLSTNLEKVVLRLRCQTRVQYAHSVRWFLMQLKAH